MTTVTIGSGVTTIERDAFSGCSKLMAARLLGNAPNSMGNGVFDGCADGFVIHFTAGASGWTNPWNGYPATSGNTPPATSGNTPPATSGSDHPTSVTVTGVSPSPVPGLSALQYVTVVGTGFSKSSVVRVGTPAENWSKALASSQVTFVSSTSLKMHINTTAVTDAWWIQVSTGTNSSARFPFQVVVPAGTSTQGKVTPNTASTRSVAQSSIRSAQATVAQQKSKGFIVGDASSLLAQSETAFGKGDYETAQNLAAQASASAEEIGTVGSDAKSLIAGAVNAVQDQADAGFNVGEAAALLTQSETAFGKGDYLAARELSSQASSNAEDVDGDGVANRKDFAPYINNRVIYLVGALALAVSWLVVAVIVGSRRKKTFLKKRREIESTILATESLLTAALKRVGTLQDPVWSQGATTLARSVAVLLQQLEATTLNEYRTAPVVLASLQRDAVSLSEYATALCNCVNTCVVQQDPSEKVLAVYDGFLKRAGDRGGPDLRALADMVHLEKGRVLYALGHGNEALAEYEELLSRLGDEKDPTALKLAAMALFEKGRVLHALHHNDDALATYDDLLGRFGEATDPIVGRLVASTQLYRSILLAVWGRRVDALSGFRDLVRVLDQ
jgi:tetratricopeptide (TPR) repeat protein